MSWPLSIVIWTLALKPRGKCLLRSVTTKWEKMEAFLLLKHLVLYIPSNNATEVIAVLEIWRGLTDPQ